jgi:serine/threonine protein kinase
MIVCRYNFKADLWSLGCLVYEAAALRLPWSAPSISLLLAKIETTPCDPLPPQVYSKEFNGLVMMLLERVCSVLKSSQIWVSACLFVYLFLFSGYGAAGECRSDSETPPGPQANGGVSSPLFAVV